MYKDDCIVVNEYAQRGPDELRLTLAMVILSIRQSWSSVGVQLQDFKEYGVHSKYVWGNKTNSILWLDENIDSLYRDAMANKGYPVQLMHAFLQIPGIGLAKAGFCCQLFEGSVGCLDSHNTDNYDVSPGMLTLNKAATPETVNAKVVTYVEWCAKRRSEFLWNRWCTLIANKQPKRWVNADHVSKVHVEYLKLGGDE